METIENRKRTEVDMAGTKFYADVIEDAFIQINNPNNRISPLEIITFDDHHELLFDLRTKNSYCGRWDLPVDRDRAEYIWLRNLYSLDPEGMAYLVDNGHKHLDWSRYFDMPLPAVPIDGTDFIIDPIKNVFRQTGNPWNFMSFKHVSFRGNDTGYYFDRHAKNLAFPHEFDMDGPEAKFPPHIVFARIPSGEEIADLCRPVRAALDKKWEEQNRKTRLGKKL